MKMIVSAARRMLSAISFGVLRREALSTRPIIRSRKVSPGLAVISITIRSESTRVPPVTALRSPPASLMTGADSPVMADSSTEAMPSTTVPSPGIRSLASQTTRSPLWSWLAGTRSSPCSSTSRRAISSARVRRRAAACALPRPSATASAKLANRTVNQSQSATWPTKSCVLPVAPWKKPTTNTIVVMTDPTSTTNITGLRACHRGSSFRKLSRIAGTRISRSRKLACLRRRYCSERLLCSIFTSVGKLAGGELEVLEKRSQRQRREEGECADDEDHAYEQPGEERGVGGERALARRHHLLAGQGAGQRQQRDHEDVASQPHGGAAHRVVVHGVTGQPGECAAVVAELGRERVQDLTEAVCPGVEGARLARRQKYGERGEAEDDGRPSQQRQHGHPDLAGLYLLAQVFRSPTDHQARDEDRDDGEHQHPVEAGADATWRDLPQLDQDHRHHAADRREAVVAGVDRARAGGRGGGGELSRVNGAEPDRLALQVAAGLGRCSGLADADTRERRIADLLGAGRDAGRADQDQRHRSTDGEALLHVADPAAEHDGQPEGDPQFQEDLEVVREPVRVLERVRRIGIEGPASVVAQVLDHLLGGERADGDGLLDPLQRVRDGVAGQGLGHALGGQDQRSHYGDRKQDVEDGAGG